MKIFDYDGYPAVFLHDVCEALQDKDCKLAILEGQIAELEGVIAGLEERLQGYKDELKI